MLYTITMSARKKNSNAREQMKDWFIDEDIIRKKKETNVGR